MGGLYAVEDRPTPKEVYNWRLYKPDRYFLRATLVLRRLQLLASRATSHLRSKQVPSSALYSATFTTSNNVLLNSVTERVSRKWAL
ncbi:hypothetical protein E4T38_08596 [Aureobasidium subglaciale]|nr:hypothetical protein E4T38_08596 [Aureobasidium subglaciale]KAI5215136.1 hypothetical protein E4T40_08609 [Aureobasidium subglaciale]KAI5218290.1 hypothetical protein E4T41_08463 [Aureobasidium subglaciale]KAI5255999.1 hypothetical protein E4T46_08497 [Aureobasidium subglaciale]